MKLTSSQIKKYNKIADAGKKPIMVRVGSKWYTWYEGDPKYGVFLTTQSGKDVEFDFKQIDDIQENKMEKMKSKLREIIREEINESALYNRAGGLVKTKDLYTFVKAGKAMKHELAKDGWDDTDVRLFLNELMKRRIF